MYNAKKAATNQAWDRENMTRLACKITKDRAEDFRRICQGEGLSIHAALKRYVDACIEAGQMVKLPGDQ